MISVSGWATDQNIVDQATVHAALGEPARLAIVNDLVVSDRSPRELADRLGIASNLLAHHLDTLDAAGVISRAVSSGDGRRKYVRLTARALPFIAAKPPLPTGDMLFLCTRNSARSQLAAALYTRVTGRRATSAGTDPAPHIHRGALAAARRAGLHIVDAPPRAIGTIARDTRVVTVCDIAHEHLDCDDWWHWSIPDPAESGSAHDFDSVIGQLRERIDRFEGAHA